MSFHWIFRLPKTADSGRLPQRAPSHRPRKLYLEALEDRTLPSSLLPATDPFANAQNIVVSGTGITSQAGTIATPGEVDMFKFTAPITGLMNIEVSPDPLIRVQDIFDESQHVIASPPGPTLFEPVSISVVQGHNYFVQVGAGSGITGSYFLKFSPDDFGNTFADAHTVTLDSSGAGSQAGSIEIPGDVDMFKFSAPITGLIAIGLSISSWSPNDATLHVYDASQNSIDFRDPGSVIESSINAVAGSTYFVQVGTWGGVFSGGTGPYVLSFSPDDFGNTFDQAHPFALDASGFGSQSGTVELPGDVDTFQFVAPYSGLIQVQLGGPPGQAPFVGFFFISDASQQVIAGRLPLMTNQTVAVNFEAGKTYYAQVGGYYAGPDGNNTSGPYVLTFAPVADDFGNTFADAHPIQLDSVGAAAQAGTFERANDVDMFQFVANRTGLMTIRASDPPINYGNFNLSVFNSNQELITSASGMKLSHEAVASFPIVEGEQYYLQVTPSDPSQISYSMILASDDAADTFATAQNISFDDRNVSVIDSRIDLPGDTDMFQFTAPSNGPVTFRLTRDVLDIFDSSGNVIAAAQNQRFQEPDPITIKVKAGNKYYLQVSDFFQNPLSGTGPYTLEFYYDDGFGKTFLDATSIPLSPSGFASQLGSIEVVQDIDMFRFVGLQTELFKIQDTESRGTGGLRIELFNQFEELIASSTSKAPLEIEALSGEALFVRVESEEGTVGEYDLTFSGIPIPSSNLSIPEKDSSPATLPAVFVLNGPGFEKSVDIFSTSASPPANPEPSRPGENVPLAQVGFGLLAPLLHAGGTGNESPEEKAPSRPESAVIRFMIGLDDPFATQPPTPLAPNENSDLPPPDDPTSNHETWERGSADAPTGRLARNDKRGMMNDEQDNSGHSSLILHHSSLESGPREAEGDEFPTHPVDDLLIRKITLFPRTGDLEANFKQSNIEDQDETIWGRPAATRKILQHLQVISRKFEEHWAALLFLAAPTLAGALGHPRPWREGSERDPVPGYGRRAR